MELGDRPWWHHAAFGGALVALVVIGVIIAKKRHSADDRLLFACGEKGPEVCVADPDAWSVARLGAGTPSGWSPDGLRILVVARVWSADEIFVMQADGSSRVQLGALAGSKYEPRFSPDASRIAFVFVTPGTDGWRQLGVMNADGSDARILTSDRSSKSALSWSPDGTTIVYAAHLTQSTSVIESIDVASGAITRLTDPSAFARAPVFSPDGSRIIHCLVSATGSGVYSIALDGSDPRLLLASTAAAALADGAAGCTQIGWSPAGDRIAVSLTSGSSFVKDRIVVMRSDGSEAKLLLPGMSRGVAWSPDGRRLAFVGMPSNNNSDRIYVADADGSHLDVVSGPERVGQPSWRPKR